MLEAELAKLREFLQKNLEQGFLQPMKTPGGAPVFFVNKKDTSEKRLVVDYRKTNQRMIPRRYPFPRIGDLLERLRLVKIFMKLDQRGAYNLIRVRQGNEWKAAFNTRYGTFE